LFVTFETETELVSEAAEDAGDVSAAPLSLAPPLVSLKAEAL
jgi:hypothetical protein